MRDIYSKINLILLFSVINMILVTSFHYHESKYLDSNYSEKQKHIEFIQDDCPICDINHHEEKYLHSNTVAISPILEFDNKLLFTHQSQLDQSNSIITGRSPPGLSV